MEASIWHVKKTHDFMLMVQEFEKEVYSTGKYYNQAEGEY